MHLPRGAANQNTAASIAGAKCEFYCLGVLSSSAVNVARLHVFLFLGFYFLLKEVEVLFFKVRVQLNRLTNGDNLKQKAPHSAKSRVVKEILFSYLLILIIKEIPFSYLLILIMIHLTPHLIHTHTHTVIEVHSALGFACKQIVLARIDLKLCIGL